MVPNWFAFIRLFYIWDLKSGSSENNEGEYVHFIFLQAVSALSWEKTGVAVVFALCLL